MSMITRRLMIQALPFIGAAAGIPVALAVPTEANEAQSAQEQIDHHVAELVKLITDTAGPCDGWRLYISSNPWDHPEPFLRAERFWRVNERMRDGSPRTMLVDRMRTFNHRTGEHNDYDPMIDLAGWVPKAGGINV
ncbi:hypothetical protein [Devosia sp. Root436]|uniref:hypothetical protein n=1 Tax=Devosia sp. Root436 TaxID=1736537 RepID=UPI000ABE3ACA|nr:hypothetical protein [Devosia sp. Root436]